MADGEMEGLVVSDCTKCSELVSSRSQIVNGTGPPDADVLFIGEAPGAAEDRKGEPFVGRSGDVLDQHIGDIGLNRGDVRITNCVRCRPPENRDPNRSERRNCIGYLHREITSVDPTVIVTLGKVPSEELLDRSVAVTKEAGRIEHLQLGDRSYRVLISIHPAATLYDPSNGETLESVMRSIADLLDLDVDADDDDQSTLGQF